MFCFTLPVSLFSKFSPLICDLSLCIQSFSVPSVSPSVLLLVSLSVCSKFFVFVVFSLIPISLFGVSFVACLCFFWTSASHD